MEMAEIQFKNWKSKETRRSIKSFYPGSLYR